jgi:hypothetical protein
MNIPQSTLAPFGYTGMPTVQLQVDMGDLLDTMFKYSDVKASPNTRVQYFMAMMRQVCNHHKIESPEVWRCDEEDSIKLIVTYIESGAILARQKTYHMYRTLKKV